jgi:predicted nucleotidyltransferase
MTKTDELVSKLKNFFVAKEEVILAFLFGSQIYGSRFQADVDIAIWLTDSSYKRINNIWSELENLLNTDVDLIVLNTASPTIAWSAIRGVPILIRNYKFYLEYMLRISHEAEDFQEFIFDLFRWRQRIGV